MSDSVTKSDLTEILADRLGVSKGEAKEAIDTLTEIITESLTNGNGQKVTIHGFGTFDVSHRDARKGVDPQDHSKEITIPARTVPKFRPGSTLKRSVRQAHSDS